MTNEEVKEFLIHSGIKDQKWYHRRYQNYDGTYTEEGKARKRAAYRAASDDYLLSRRDPAGLSNDELKRASDRKRLEAEYTDNRIKSSGAVKATKYVAAGAAIAALVVAGVIAGKKIHGAYAESQNPNRVNFNKAQKEALEHIWANTTAEDLKPTMKEGVFNAAKEYAKAQTAGNPDVTSATLEALKSLKMSDLNDSADILIHHGIKGQKWGVRRFQNPDGSLTPLGRKRYGVKNYSDLTPAQKRDANKHDKDIEEKEAKEFAEREKTIRAKNKSASEIRALREDAKAERSMIRAEAREERKAFRQEERMRHAEKIQRNMLIGTMAVAGLVAIGSIAAITKAKMAGREMNVKAQQKLLDKQAAKDAAKSGKKTIAEAAKSVQAANGAQAAKNIVSNGGLKFNPNIIYAAGPTTYYRPSLTPPANLKGATAELLKALPAPKH